MNESPRIIIEIEDGKFTVISNLKNNEDIVNILIDALDAVKTKNYETKDSNNSKQS
jgi:hypothetical protein